MTLKLVCAFRGKVKDKDEDTSTLFKRLVSVPVIVRTLIWTIILSTAAVSWAAKDEDIQEPANKKTSEAA